MTTRSINKRTKINVIFPVQSSPVIELNDTLIKVNNNGNTTGKLNIAIKVKLLLDLEAMAETIVNIDANPNPPRIIVIMKR